MNRWSALAVLLAIAGALALRVPRLATRPLHNDEAVNAVKVSELWEHGRYAYDPDEYHGPALHYATLLFLWLSGAHNPDEVGDATLRLAPVAFGVGLVLLLLLFADGLGRGAVAWAAIFAAVSPAMVFYSRYFIHEMLLVFFTALTLGAGWRYVQARLWRRDSSLIPEPGRAAPPRRPFYSPPARRAADDQGGAAAPPYQASSLPLAVEAKGKSEVLWAVMTGVGLGLMFTTKETFVITLAAMGVAGIATAWWTMARCPGVRDLLAFWNWKHAALALGAAFIIWLLLFSSFFTNFTGLLDSARTYLPWLKRAGGHSPHIHPWYFYLQRLAWFHPAKAPAWSEGLVLVLAVVGAVVSLAGSSPSPLNGLRAKPRRRMSSDRAGVRGENASGFAQPAVLHRFLALYTIILTALYSAISYKTPWCLLNFYLGMILLAGVGAAALVEFFRARSWRVVMTVVLAALTLQLSWQAWRASFVYSADRRNPYVYAQTASDLLNLVQRTEGIARVAPTRFETVVKIVAPENDYWPMPWYLRRFKHLGWYDKLPEDPYAPIVVVSSKLDARLDEKSGRKWIMAGLTELRPGRYFELYVELELWKKYVETLPKDRD